MKNILDESDVMEPFVMSIDLLRWDEPHWPQPLQSNPNHPATQQQIEVKIILKKFKYKRKS